MMMMTMMIFFCTFLLCFYDLQSCHDTRFWFLLAPVLWLQPHRWYSLAPSCGCSQTCKFLWRTSRNFFCSTLCHPAFHNLFLHHWFHTVSASGRKGSGQLCTSLTLGYWQDRHLNQRQLWIDGCCGYAWAARQEVRDPSCLEEILAWHNTALLHWFSIQYYWSLKAISNIFMFILKFSVW